MGSENLNDCGPSVATQGGSCKVKSCDCAALSWSHVTCDVTHTRRRKAVSEGNCEGGQLLVSIRGRVASLEWRGRKGARPTLFFVLVLLKALCIEGCSCCSFIGTVHL